MVIQIFFGTISYVLFVLALILQVICLVGFYTGIIFQPLERDSVIILLLLTLSLYGGAFVSNFFARK